MNVMVSVVIATCNPKWDNLVNTLKSILCQQEISYQIIISDDGSQNFNKDRIESYFKYNKFDNYKICESEVNEGTVRNCLKGLKHAEGKYTYLISPGDMLYDSKTLVDLFDFAEKQSAKICFGNAVYYKNGEVFSTTSNPVRTNLYYFDNLFVNKIAFFFSGLILGAAYFRDTKYLIKCLEDILKTTKYVEDSTSSMVALAQGEQIKYINRNIVFYEYGDGISTNNQIKWKRIIQEEYEKTLSFLASKKYDPAFDAAIMITKYKNRYVRILFRILKHPIISMIVAFSSLGKTRITESGRAIQDKLNKIMK